MNILMISTESAYYAKSSKFFIDINCEIRLGSFLYNGYMILARFKRRLRILEKNIVMNVETGC